MVRIRTTVITAVMAGSLLLPAGVAGQLPYVWVAPSAGVSSEEKSPFAMLLERREELDLLPAQVERIERLGERLDELNDRLLALIRDAEVFGADGAEEREVLAAAEEALAANGREAEREVREILTPEQRTEARELFGDDSWARPAHSEEGHGTGEGAAEREAEPTTVTVQNYNYYDANIFVVSGGRRQRLGFVTGLNTETFTIPDAFIAASGPLRFEVRQIPQHRLPPSDAVSVFPGDAVFLRIPPS